MKKLNIISKKAFIFILFLSSMVFISCTKNYEKINTDKSSISDIGPAELPFLFSKAIASVPWNDQTAQNLYADQYAQYFACIASYFPTDRLVMDMGWLASAFDPIYTEIVPQLQSIFEATDSSSSEYALANIWWVYSFHRVTDYWGPIPYFNAGKPGASVPYDSQEDIYNDFFKRLTKSVAILKTKTNEHPFESFDLLYGGDVNKWIKFANTLRLRLALRVSKVNPELARMEAESAYDDGVMTVSPDDDALAKRNSIDRNRISIMSEWNEFRMSAAMETFLKGYSDPRISVYFIPTVNTNTFEGLRNGLTPTQLTQPVNSANANSHVGPLWSNPKSGGIADYLSTPQNVMCAAETYFLRAEGALLGWNMGGTPKDLYEQGISNSMAQWGIIDNNKIQTYINNTSVPTAPQDYLNSPAISNVPVKFEAADKNIQAEQIATQKWLALFPDGVEAWADYRRSHLVKLYPIANSDNPDITDPTQKWIRRVPFLLSEKQTNGAEIEKAIQLLGGQDKITTPLWWDKN